MRNTVFAKVLLGGVALLALTVTGASAADLAVKAPKAPILKAPPMQAWSWAGTYFGANVGYGWASDPTSLTDTTTITSSTTHDATVPNPIFVANPTIVTVASGSGNANATGWLGGIQLGHNWQSGTYVFGLEADVQASGQRGSVTICDTVGCPVGTGIANATVKLPWFATFRGRLGFTPANRWLLYVTGGLAVAETDVDGSGGPVGGAATIVASNHPVRAGYTVGGGVETAFADNWSLKLEYLFMDYGNVGASGSSAPVTVATFNGPRIETITITTNTATLSTHVTDNIVRLGLNYRFAP